MVLLVENVKTVWAMIEQHGTGQTAHRNLAYICSSRNSKIAIEAMVIKSSVSKYIV